MMLLVLTISITFVSCKKEGVTAAAPTVTDVCPNMPGVQTSTSQCPNLPPTPTVLDLQASNGTVFKNCSDTIDVSSNGQFVTATIGSTIQTVIGGKYIVPNVTGDVMITFNAVNKSSDGTLTSAPLSKIITIHSYSTTRTYLSWDSVRAQLGKWKMSSFTITVVSTGAITVGNLDCNKYTYLTNNICQITIGECIVNPPPGSVFTASYGLISNETQLDQGPSNIWNIDLINDSTLRISQQKLDSDGITRLRIQTFTKIQQ